MSAPAQEEAHPDPECSRSGPSQSNRSLGNGGSLGCPARSLQHLNFDLWAGREVALVEWRQDCVLHLSPVPGGILELTHRSQGWFLVFCIHGPMTRGF